jgi:anti-sigma regulatory factor (Ser/Thr protein kinase)
MPPTSYPIEGGDYQRAGAASRALKEQLKRIGADPSAIRRAVIAAYEAEMSVVIHASSGCLKATLDERRLDVEVADEGPGVLRAAPSSASPASATS